MSPFVKSGIPDVNGNIGHRVFAVKICCTQTPGARPFVLLQLAPTPINGKAQRLAFGGLMATGSIGERILCALLLPRSGASDRDRDLGGATLLSSPTTTTSTTITNIGASVTKQNHQPLTVHVNQRWQLLITTPEVDEQSHKLWVLPSLWKRDWVCALLAPSTLSWVRLHCARQSAVHCALCAPDAERHQERREAAVEERKGLGGKARRRSQLCRKGNSPAQLCKKRFVEESHPVIRPLSVSFLFRTSGKEYHSQAGHCDGLKLSPRNDIKSDNMFKHIHIQ